MIAPDSIRQAALQWKKDNRTFFPSCFLSWIHKVEFVMRGLRFGFSLDFTLSAISHYSRFHIVSDYNHRNASSQTQPLCLLRHKHHTAEERRHHGQSTPQSTPHLQHVVRVRRAYPLLLLHLKPAIHNRLLQLLVRQLNAPSIAFVHLLRRDVLRTLRLTHTALRHLPVIQQRTQVDPVAARLQDLVNQFHVPDHHDPSQPSLEHHRRRVHEEARQHAVPLALLLLVALHELAGAHGEVAAVLDGEARNHVRDLDRTVVVARGEDVVGAVRPRIDRDLVGREVCKRLRSFPQTRDSACNSTPAAFGTRTRFPGRRTRAPPPP